MKTPITYYGGKQQMAKTITCSHKLSERRLTSILPSAPMAKQVNTKSPDESSTIISTKASVSQSSQMFSRKYCIINNGLQFFQFTFSCNISAQWAVAA